MVTYSVVEKIFWFAITTRIFIIVLQFISNILIPDHNANVFLSPDETDLIQNQTLIDNVLQTCLKGFLRWDGQYFWHIIKYGYTYEHTLAFFPLFPFIVKFVSLPFKYIFYKIMNFDTIYLISIICLNSVFFIKSAFVLYKLSLRILRNQKRAYYAAILFCVNPANIFFMAPYTECIFSWLTFSGMLNCINLFESNINYKDECLKNNPINKKNKKTKDVIDYTFKKLLYFSLIASLPIGLSAATRSNGLLNIGFIIYFFLKLFMSTILQLYQKYHMLKKRYYLLVLVFCSTIIFYILLSVFVSILPFILIQIYDYVKFCTDHEDNLPTFLVNYGNSNNFILPGKYSQHFQPWCNKSFPLAYSYVQNHYWHVGFLKYYQLKQIPNFLLAAPIIYIILTKSFQFLKQHKSYCLTLGFIDKEITKCKNTYYEKEMFVFVVHSLFITIFCIFFVHIQITTRMICSASPILYWYGAYVFNEHDSSVSNNSLNERLGQILNVSNEIHVESYENSCSKWKTFILTEKFVTVEIKCLQYYFLSYFIVGTIMFCNFLPWT